ncbi:Nascent polypeptide-associated complex subunit alpha-like, UBA domain [Dillenia turbinata]|uniref:Nascent polypeptide-associated complex subunit alpha-like, UBA domain n=1 Tax=Dillenia turbinata TaxID=194707 RepID=A0AAN8VMQ8_9MAGN
MQDISARNSHLQPLSTKPAVNRIEDEAGESSKQSRSEEFFTNSFFLVNQILFFFSKPNIFKSPNSETCVIFGEAKMEDLSSQLQTQAAQQSRMLDTGSVMAKSDTSAPATGAPAAEKEEEVDDTGVEARDIDLVMIQAGVSRNKAVKALKIDNGDISS